MKCLNYDSHTYEIKKNDNVIYEIKLWDKVIVITSQIYGMQSIKIKSQNYKTNMSHTYGKNYYITLWY